MILVGPNGLIRFVVFLGEEVFLHTNRISRKYQNDSESINTKPTQVITSTFDSIVSSKKDFEIIHKIVDSTVGESRHCLLKSKKNWIW